MALDFLPEQETVQKQYYTGIGEYNEQYKNSNLNKIYKKIINQKKIRAGFEDNWYDVWYDSMNAGSEWSIWFKTREWFECCIESPDLLVRDIKIVDWVIYMLVDNRDTDWNWHSYLQYNCTALKRRTDCDYYIDWKCSDTLNTIEFDTTQPWRPCNNIAPWFCTYKKLLTTYWPKNYRSQWKASIEVKLVGNNLYSYVTSSNPLTIGSYIYFNFSTTETNVVWYWRKIISYDGATNKYLLDSNIPVPTWNLVDWYIDDNMYYTERGWLWHTLLYVNGNGVVQLHEVDCTTWQWQATYVPKTYDPQWIWSNIDCNASWWEQIHSIFSFADQFWFIKWTKLFLSEWWADAFLTSELFNLNKDYQDVVEFWQYAYLLWPEWFGVMYRFFDSTWKAFYRIVDTEDWLPYFNKYSYIKHRWAFYIGTEDRYGSLRWNALYVNPSDRWWWQYDFSIWYSILSRDFITKEFRAINKRRWDIITVSEIDDSIVIFANAWMQSSTKWTNIFFYDTDDKFWHQRTVCWKQISWYKHWIRFHNHISKEWGNNDWWNTITSILWISFWQQSIFSPKWIQWIHFGLNYDSFTTDQSHIYESINFQWYNRNRRHRLSSTYLDNLWTYRHTWNWTPLNKEATNNLMLKMPLSLWLYWGNGISNTKVEELTLAKHIDVLCSYRPDNIKECVDDCLWNELTERTNMYDAENWYRFEIAKFAPHYFHIGDQADHMYIEFVAHTPDVISFIGYMIVYHYVPRDNLTMWWNTITTNNLKNISCKKEIC